MNSKPDNGKSGKPHQTGHRKRLRQRYVEKGASSLAEYEMLELLLTYVRAQKDVKPEAKRLLRKFGSIREVLDADRELLMEIDGIGIQTATLIKLVKDLGTAYLRHKQIKRKKVNGAYDIIDYLKATVGSNPNEQFLVLYLNTMNEVLADELMDEGVVNTAVIYPRKIIENALKHNASALIIAHNHPSGDAAPSSDDIHLTRTLKQIGAGLGIEVQDHIIVTKHKFVSFSATGRL
jgi:DNA repair protein RadC